MARTKANPVKCVVSTTVGPTGEKQIVVRKKHRYRPGTRARMEIRKYTTGKCATQTLIPKAKIGRLVRELLQDASVDIRITAKAMEALHQGTLFYFLQPFVCVCLTHRYDGCRRPYGS
jgi:hypothetical protein